MTQRYEIYTSPQGHSSIRQLSSREIMHPCGDPFAEAQNLYVKQSRLSYLLKEPSKEPLHIWDVGLGAACNALAAVHTALELQDRNELKRPFDLTSFEIDEEPLQLVISRPDLFTYADHPATKAILKNRAYSSGQVSWKLLLGDYKEQIHQAPFPELIFYDPFSYKTEDAPLWSEKSFQLLRSKLQMSPHQTTLIYTYSRATRVRTVLLAAGFYVAKGVATGAKSETTVAAHFNGAVSAELLRELEESRGLYWLEDQWLGRWCRSHIRTESGGDYFDLAIQKHPQFTKTSA